MRNADINELGETAVKKGGDVKEETTQRNQIREFIMGGIKSLDLIGIKPLNNTTQNNKKEVNMKAKIAGMVVALATIALLVGCASVPKAGVPGAKGMAKKAATEATVEVLEVNVEKVTWESAISGKMYGVKITGTAVYHPPKVGGKTFVEATRGKEFVLDLYDNQGRKLPVQVTFNAKEGKCGPNGMPEDVVPNKPFTFERRSGIASEDEPKNIAIWEKVASAKFVKWE